MKETETATEMAWLAGLFDTCGEVDKIYYPQDDDGKFLIRIRHHDLSLLMHSQKLVGGNVFVRGEGKSLVLRKAEDSARFITKIYPYTTRTEYIVKHLMEANNSARKANVEVAESEG